MMNTRNTIMKRILICIICVILVVGIAACGSKNEEPPVGNEGDTFTFSTKDMDGNAFTSDDVKDAKLVMINLWEPWCGPCVEELPYLAKVYEENKDRGFVILGVFSETTMDEEAKSTLSKAGVTYPVLRANGEFSGFETGYVPTTVFLTGEGKLISEEPLIGSRSYEDWTIIVQSLLDDLEQ